MMRALRWVSIVATLTLTSTFEYLLGYALPALPHVTTGGVEWSPFAVVMPLAIDAYVMAALLSGADRLFALAILETAVLVGSVHAVDNTRDAALSAVAGTVLVLVLWRVDELFRAEHQARAAAELQAELDRAARDREAADRAVALERAATERATAEATAARERANADRATATPPTGRPARRPRPRPEPRDDLAGRRAVRVEWEDAGRTWTTAKLAERLGVTEDAARAQANRWRRADVAVGE